MSQLLWGPQAWRLLHAVAYAWPDRVVDDRLAETGQEFVRSLLLVLPCRKCAEHVAGEVENVPLFSTRRQFQRYVRYLHNKVSQRVSGTKWTAFQAERYHNPTVWRLKHMVSRVLRIVGACVMAWAVLVWFYPPCQVYAVAALRTVLPSSEYEPSSVGSRDGTISVSASLA